MSLFWGSAITLFLVLCSLLKKYILTGKTNIFLAIMRLLENNDCKNIQ